MTVQKLSPNTGQASGTRQRCRPAEQCWIGGTAHRAGGRRKRRWYLTKVAALGFDSDDQGNYAVRFLQQGRAMPGVPDRPKIYHITHLRNLPQIVAEGGIWSDARCVELGLKCEVVGMSEIKRRRLEELEVKCHSGTKVGQYVPFYFCPRSIMLYILHRGNHPDLKYRGGQAPVLHLQADLHATVKWVNKNRHVGVQQYKRGSLLRRLFQNLDRLSEVNWSAVAATDFRTAAVKEGKQAEFLVFGGFPWSQVERIGVFDREIERKIRKVLEGADHRPAVKVTPVGIIEDGLPMIQFKAGDILQAERRGSGQHGELRGDHGPRDRFPIPQGISREL